MWSSQNKAFVLVFLILFSWCNLILGQKSGESPTTSSHNSSSLFEGHDSDHILVVIPTQYLDSIPESAKERFLEINDKFAEIDHRRNAALYSSLLSKLPQADREFAQNSPLDMFDLQTYIRYCQPQSGFISYSLDQHYVCVFVITKENCVLRAIRRPLDLHQKIDAFLENLNRSKFGTAQISKEQQHYEDHAHSLYQTLFKPISGWVKNCDRLVISPGQELESIPFEVLLERRGKEGEKYDQLKYLNNRFAISYAYSARTLMLQKIKARDQHWKGWTGFAPFCDNKPNTYLDNDLPRGATLNSLPTLPQSDDELRDIKGILNSSGSKLFMGANATVACFEKLKTCPSILQFITHGNVGSQSVAPFLQMFPDSNSPGQGRLTAPHIASLNIPSKHVVLDACESGKKNPHFSGCKASIADAFAFAGAASTLHSRWEIEDGKSRTLINLYYKGLKKGMSKDVALQKAKKEYLTENNGHLGYWASFSVTGDTTPIYIPDQAYEDEDLPFLLSLLILFLLLGLSRYLKRKSWFRRSSI